tara:strand:+ start:3292 stop:3789 length:498 start_codon:yes stop_codon:yes gene_type:complete
MNDKPIRESVGMELNSNYFVPDHKNWSYDKPNYYVSRVLYSSSNWAFINDDLDIFPNRKILEKKKNLRIIWDSNDHNHLDYWGYYDNFPFTHKNIRRWVILEDMTAVGFNENPSIGWSYPTKKMKGLPTSGGRILLPRWSIEDHKYIPRDIKDKILSLLKIHCEH